MPILAILFTCRDSSSPQSQGGRPIKPRESVMGTKGVGYVHKAGSVMGNKGVNTKDTRGRFSNHNRVGS